MASIAASFSDGGNLVNDVLAEISVASALRELGDAHSSLRNGGAMRVDSVFTGSPGCPFCVSAGGPRSVPLSSEGFRPRVDRRDLGASFLGPQSVRRPVSFAGRVDGLGGRPQRHDTGLPRVRLHKSCSLMRHHGPTLSKATASASTRRPKRSFQGFHTMNTKNVEQLEARLNNI